MRSNLVKSLLIVLSALNSLSFAQEQKSFQLSTHVLDIHSGQPAQNVAVELFKLDSKKQWVSVATNTTDKNGRIANFLDSANKNQGTYKLVFQTGKYLTSRKQNTVFPYVEIVFTIPDNQHYHIPITIAGNGYSTYRGS